MKLRAAFLNLMYPIVRLVGELRIGPAHRKVKFINVAEVQGKLKEGDVICTFAQGELTNLFIGGEFKHSAMFIAGEIIEATREGVHFTDLEDFLMSKDKFAVVRPKFPLDTSEVFRSCLAYLNRPYDYSFEPGIEAFACAELVGQLLADGAGKEIPFTKRKVLGVLTIHPSDFVEATDKFERIY